MSVLWKNHRKKGSITAEAGLVFPIFFFAVMALCYIFIFLETQYTIQKGMLYSARKISAYGDIVSFIDEKKKELLKTAGNSVLSTLGSSSLVTQLIDAPVADAVMTQELSEMSDGLGGIVKGVKGISYLSSQISGSDDFVIKCTYRLSVPFALPEKFGIDTGQSLRYRYFTGYKPESLLSEKEDEDGISESTDEEDDELVYITETGSVYHKSLDCPALRIKVSECAFDDVGKRRNIAGCKYYPCEYCAHGSRPGTVYITEDGRRYHYSSSCGELKRTITQVKKSEVPNRRGCKRCCGKE